MSDVTVALAGGAIGSVITAGLTQVGRARVAWSEVTLHDQQATQRNDQLVAYADDGTQKLVRELSTVAEDHNARNTLRSSKCLADLAARKGEALHRYRDEEWGVRIELAVLKAQEGGWHVAFRWLRRRRNGLALTARTKVEPFLERWREPIDRYGLGPVEVFDLTTRTEADALKELPSLPLT
jgi:hypothetical protein